MRVVSDKTDLPIIGEGALMAQLTRARDRSMHSIVATIQAEQDKAIRAPAKGVVTIAGGPGTGKTVVALHRAAYLLYSDRRRYETGGVLVIGPSGVFMRYIERVLPSLGETAVALRSLGEVVEGVVASRHDLPAVAERARARFAAAGLAPRADAVGGDFLSAPLPRGADVISLVRVIHDHDDPAASAILRAVRAALPPDGTLLLAEPMSGTPGAEPIGDAYFGFYLLAMGRGRARTPAELAALLEAAGFDRIRRLRTRTPLLVSLMVAQPAADQAGTVNVG